MKPTPAYLGRLASLGSMNLGYTDLKPEFHQKAKKVLRYVAEQLGLKKGEFNIRSNMGGIAVSGEVALHANDIYIQMDAWNMGGKFMFRSCKGQRDYTGGPNNWMFWKDIRDIDKAIERFQQVRILVAV
jgi:hypothetical protein